MNEPLNCSQVGNVGAFLDPEETNSHIDADHSNGSGVPTLEDSQAFRHSGWRRTRDRVDAALKRTQAPIARICAFESCGCFAWVMQSKTNPNAFRLSTNRCHDRFCTPCAVERAKTVQAAITERMGVDRYRLVTLTLKHSPESLTARLTELSDCFNKLRRVKFWTRAVAGGLAVTEIKINTDTGAWHVHLHLLVHGKYLDQKTLKEHWYRITGDSFIVDVRAVPMNASGANYVAKYATKAFDHTVTTKDEWLDEAIRALKGRRLITTFGDWRGFSLTVEEPSGDGWEMVADFDRVIALAQAQHPGAMWLIQYFEALRGNAEPPEGDFPGMPTPGDNERTTHDHRKHLTEGRFDWDGTTQLDFAADDSHRLQP